VESIGRETRQHESYDDLSERRCNLFRSGKDQQRDAGDEHEAHADSGDQASDGNRPLEYAPGHTAELGPLLFLHGDLPRGL
jgi:hypothetical protein